MLCFCFPLLFCPISILLHPPPNITPILHLSPHRALLRPHGTQTRNPLLLCPKRLHSSILLLSAKTPFISTQRTPRFYRTTRTPYKPPLPPPRFPSITGYFTRHFSEYVDEELYNQSTALTRTQGPRPAEGTPPGTLV